MALLMLTKPAKMPQKTKRKDVQLYREMEYLNNVPVQILEKDALVRFYAMLNIIVTFKGRPTYEIETAVMDIKIKQPLDSAFYKMFQAMLNYPSNKPISDLVRFTCQDVLFEEIEKLQIQLGLKSDNLPQVNIEKANAKQQALTTYQKKARESRMMIYQDTITRFYSLMELYTPYKMRPRLWDEQSITEDQWNFKIKQPIREAFRTFILMMRQFPTKINRQQDLVAYTLNTLLPNCEAGMLERGLRYELSLQPKSVYRKCRPRTIKHSPSSIWTPDENDIKIAIGYHNAALRHPSDTSEAQQAMVQYQAMVGKAKDTVPPVDVTQMTESRRLSSTKSLLQNVSPPKTKDDYSWVKTDGYRVINKQDFQLPRRPHTSFDIRRVNKTTPTSASRRSRVTDVTNAQSSDTVLPSEEENENIISTNAISYRPVLSARQKSAQKSGADTKDDGIYDRFSRSSTGYPVVHSRRRRGAKSASACGRQMVAYDRTPVASS